MMFLSPLHLPQRKGVGEKARAVPAQGKGSAERLVSTHLKTEEAKNTSRRLSGLFRAHHRLALFNAAWPLSKSPRPWARMTGNVA